MFSIQKVLALFVGVVLLSAIFIKPAPGFAETGLEKRVLILYESRYFYGDARDVVLVVEELLGHFQTKVDSLDINQWDAVDFSDYDVVMYMTLDKEPSHSEVLSALKAYDGQIFWLGRGIETFLTKSDYHMAYNGVLDNLMNIKYKKSLTGQDQVFNIGVQRTFYNVIPTSEHAEVDAWLSDGTYDYPFIIRDENLVFISRVDINEPLFYIFADYLGNFLDLKQYSEDEILISIEDVNVFSDYDNVKSLVDYCYEHSIPFTMGVIPEIVQEGTDYITEFDEVSEFVTLLQYAQDHGGSLVVHVLPHEVFEGDFIIYDQSDVYLTAQDALEDFINKTLNKMFKYQLYPIGYQATHANLTLENYQYLKEHFSTSVGQLNINERNVVVYPYILYNTERFNEYLPLNLGYVDPSDETTFSLIHDRLSKIGLVNGFFSGVYFHSSLKVTYLDALVRDLGEYHLSYYDAGKTSHFVSNENYEVTIEDAMVEITMIKPEIQETPIEKGIRIMGNLIGYFLFGIFLLFLLIFMRSRYVTRKKLFKE